MVNLEGIINLVKPNQTKGLLYIYIYTHCLIMKQLILHCTCNYILCKCVGGDNNQYICLFLYLVLDGDTVHRPLTATATVSVDIDHSSPFFFFFFFFSSAPSSEMQGVKVQTCMYCRKTDLRPALNDLLWTWQAAL